jgi:hypothetical protein
MSIHASGTHVDETEFRSLIRAASHVGLAMFEGPFTGWVYSTGV